MPRDTTEQRIERSTLRILEKEGPDAVSMRRVAAAVKITPMAIYHHFGNRDVLLRSVVDKEFSQLLELIQQAPKHDSCEADIVHIMDAYIDYALTRPHIFDYVFSKPRPEARRFPDDFRARRSPTLNPIADSISHWMQQGELKQDDVWEVALELWAHAHGYVMLYRAGRFNLTPNELKLLVQRSLKRLLNGLKA